MKTSNRLRTTAALMFSAVLLSGCASSGDVVFKESSVDEGEIVADYSQSFTVQAHDINPNNTTLPDGFNFDCGLLENQFDFAVDIDYEISKRETNQFQSCIFEFEEVSLDDLQELLGVETFHDSEEGLIVVEGTDLIGATQEAADQLAEDMEDFESEDIEGLIEEENDSENTPQDSLNTDVSDTQVAEIVFEFPGEITSYTTGALIAERNLNNTVDRDRVVNQDVGSSNIIHLEGDEIFEGFQIVAEDGSSVPWWHYALWIGGFVAAGLIVWLVTMIIIVRRRDSRTSFSKFRDPHGATLDNPNGDRSQMEKERKKRLPKQMRAND